MQKARFVGMQCFHCEEKIKDLNQIAVTHSQNGKQKDVMCKKCAQSKKTLDWGVKKN